MNKKMLFLCILIWIPYLLRAQIRQLTPEKQQLLLQLGFNYYTVVKEGRIDQDSSLVFVSQKIGLSRWEVFTDGFSKQVAHAQNKWIDTRQPSAGVLHLTGLKGIEHTKLLILLGAYYAFQPGYRQTDRDTAKYFLLKAIEESKIQNSNFWINQSLCLLAKNYYKGNQVKEGNETFNKLIQNCQKSGNKIMEAKALDYQGSYCPPTPTTILLKLNSIKRANELYLQTSQPAKQINTLMNLAYLSFLLKDIKGAEANALKSLQIQNKIGFPYVHYSYNLLTLISSLNSKKEKELGYGLKAVRSALNTKDSLGLAYFYAAVGHINFGHDKNPLEFANYWDKKAVAEFQKNRDPAIYLVLSNLMENLQAMNKPQEAVTIMEKSLRLVPPVDPADKQFAYLALGTNYDNLKNYQEAERYYLLSYQSVNKTDLLTKHIRASYIKYVLAKFYFDRKKYSKSKSFLLDFLSSPASMANGKFSESDSYILLYKIDSANRDYPSALNYLRKYIELNQKLIDSNDSKQIAGLKIQFLMTQKEKDLQILQAKSDLQLQEATTVKKFTLGGITAAILIILMLSNRYHVSKKQQLEMDKKNNQLQSVIKEKDDLIKSREWLLKEVHHRVKNNLHTVTCLLESQAAYLDNDALKAIESSQHRIYAMSLIHQKLYQSDDIKTVDMALYLPEFIGYLKDSLGTGNRIRFDMNIESIKLDVAYAVPLSLIVNEAVTNCIKYAFPNNKIGFIAINMHQTGTEIQLVIADNGVGMPPEIINAPINSLGIKLIRGLTEDIKGIVNITNENGIRITIEFAKDAFMSSSSH